MDANKGTGNTHTQNGHHPQCRWFLFHLVIRVIVTVNFDAYGYTLCLFGSMFDFMFELFLNKSL